jgi:AcrR family transcriptional regulator
VSEEEFLRARSVAAKQQRENAILDAARRLGARRGIRQVTLTDIAEAVGLHKSAMLRYFETREQIFLTLTAAEWRAWSRALRSRTSALSEGADAAVVAAAIADSLVERPLFCDLLAQAPLNLERNVSIDSMRAFKLVTLEEVAAISAELGRLLGLTDEQCRRDRDQPGRRTVADGHTGSRDPTALPQRPATGPCSGGGRTAARPSTHRHPHRSAVLLFPPGVRLRCRRLGRKRRVFRSDVIDH